MARLHRSQKSPVLFFFLPHCIIYSRNEGKAYLPINYVWFVLNVHASSISFVFHPSAFRYFLAVKEGVRTRFLPFPLSPIVTYKTVTFAGTVHIKISFLNNEQGNEAGTKVSGASCSNFTISSGRWKIMYYSKFSHVALNFLHIIMKGLQGSDG